MIYDSGTQRVAQVPQLPSPRDGLLLQGRGKEADTPGVEGGVGRDRDGNHSI